MRESLIVVKSGNEKSKENTTVRKLWEEKILGKYKPGKIMGI